MRAISALIVAVLLCSPAAAQDASQCVARDPKKAGASAYAVKGSTAMEHDKVIIACTKLLEREPDNAKALLARGDQYYFYVKPKPKLKSDLDYVGRGEGGPEMTRNEAIEDRTIADWLRALSLDPDNQSKIAKGARERLVKFGGYFVNPITGALTTSNGTEIAAPISADVPPQRKSKIPLDPTADDPVSPPKRKSRIPNDPTEDAPPGSEPATPASSGIVLAPQAPKAKGAPAAGIEGAGIMLAPSNSSKPREEHAAASPADSAKTSPSVSPSSPLAIAASAPLPTLLKPQTRQAAFVVSTPTLKTPLPLYTASHALVIGIDGYADGWGRLQMAVNDAVAVAAELQRHGFSVTLLVDRDVTMPDGRKVQGLRIDRAVLISAIEAFVYGPGRNPSARLVIWYAGHGHTVDRAGYLVPQGAPNPELAQFKVRDDARIDFQSKALGMIRFGEYMREIRARHVLTIFDSCFSGTIFTTRGTTPTGYEITDKTPEPVRYFITSGDEKQPVSDDGAFRRFFIDALNGAKDPDGFSADQNEDGFVTATELGRYVAARIEYYNKDLRANPGSDKSVRQSPQKGAMLDSAYDRGEFVFRVTRPDR